MLSVCLEQNAGQEAASLQEERTYPANYTHQM
jgi:hypothetical protein